MRARSPAAERTYRQRRRLVARLLEDHPVCVRCWSARSTEVHELLSRGRGGSILDPANCVALCHTCHERITDHTAPDWRRWIRPSDGRGHAA